MNYFICIWETGSINKCPVCDIYCQWCTSFKMVHAIYKSNASRGSGFWF